MPYPPPPPKKRERSNKHLFPLPPGPSPKKRPDAREEQSASGPRRRLPDGGRAHEAGEAAPQGGAQAAGAGHGDTPPVPGASNPRVLVLFPLLLLRGKDLLLCFRVFFSSSFFPRGEWEKMVSWWLPKLFLACWLVEWLGVHFANEKVDFYEGV